MSDSAIASSEAVQPTEAVATTQTVKVKKPRSAPVPQQTVFSAFIAACAAQLTLNELAKNLKMQPGSLQQRISEFRVQFNEEITAKKAADPNFKPDWEFPSLKDGRHERQGTTRNKSVFSLFSALSNAKPVETADAESAPVSTETAPSA